MENPKNPAAKITTARAFQVYLGVCVVLILIILFSAFQRSEGGALAGEIYLRPNAAYQSEE